MPGRVRDEGAFGADGGSQLGGPVGVARDREAAAPPHALAQDVDDRADVEEPHAAPSDLHVGDGQASPFSCGRLAVRVPALTVLRQWPEEELDQLEGRRRADVLGEVAPTGNEDAV